MLAVKNRRRILALALWVGCLLCLGKTGRAEEIAAPSTAGALHLEGTQIVGEDGQPVQLRGVSTHGLAWFPQYVNQECFRQLRTEWRANVVRLAMYTAESGGFCTGGDQESLKRLIDDGIRYATEEDLYVIIDWHILSDGNPQTYQEEAKAFFEEMSAKYAHMKNVIYEICNEPNGGTEWAQIKSYAEEIIPVIRRNAPDALVLVGTPNWSQFVDEAQADPITGYDNIMYTLHFYAATHKEDLRMRMRNAVQGGLPVFVSEYGICDASGNGDIDEEEADLWVKLMDELGISYVAWNLANKDETSSMILSTCQKTGGFLEEDLSASGKWIRRMLSGETDAVSESETSPDQAEEAQTEAPSGETVFDCGQIEVHAVVKNCWGSNGEDYYQYELKLVNLSDQPCSSWEIALDFEEEFRLQDGWNGDYEKAGNSLRISSKDYNGKIGSGESIGDIGFIISGGGALSLEGPQHSHIV